MKTIVRFRWYFFDEQPLLMEELDGSVTSERLNITDKPADFVSIPEESSIRYRSRSGMAERDDDEDKEYLHEFSSNRRLIANAVVIKNYNYRTPEVDLFVNSKIEGGDVGRIYEYGGAFKDTSQGQKTAEIIARRNITRQETLTGEGNCSGLRAGCRFELVEHMRKKFNALYVITSITHNGTHPFFHTTRNEPNYQNKFVCITSERAESYAPPRITPLPKIPGIMTAVIEAEGSQYASLDEKGRYKVRLPFDMSGVNNSTASKYIRLAQPYSGSDYGMHFPSHEGTEMIVGHIDGDPDKPLGLGTIPNANTISPVKDTNKTNSVIRTAGKNEIILDDTEGSERIAVYTPHDLSFTADHNETTTIKNNSSRSVGGDASDSVSGNSSVTVSKDSTETVKQNKTITIDGTHTETVKGDTSVTISSGGYTLDVQSGTGTIKVKGNVTETFQGEQKTTVTKGITVTSSSNSIKLKAATDITLEVGMSKLEMKRDGTINLSGVKIGVKGMDLALTGSASVNISGLSITSAATADHNISGMIVKSEGAVSNTVKGTSVMLNP
ncbi:MAG: type VI secretion system tip protein VgrG [Chitinispirillaceae bacterium]|nr:type VI secretion system tip protein VgrG [Chitinispirillaceae bacterium]